MARYGQRPENALKRANEFIEVSKPARALDTLYEVFRNKKWAYNWTESVLEPIMFKYLDLCVELKKSHIAKEGLFQYRNMFQSVNVSSLENVIRGYLRTAEERTESAREQSQQAVIDIDDLDMLATPESILLSAVSGEDAQDRSDRTILTPWVKFLWESYCQCLELLRTNAHVETLYHDIARMAFSFCLKYNRKTEFRKLCDKLRKHLEDISKLPAQTANVSIQKQETQQLNLDTRLVQLDSAIQMELWQEAYKAIEDIHGLMNLSKKPPVPKTMANYYQKLAMVFWKAGNYLFHAAALFKLFQLSKEMKKNITPEELQRMACRVLLATLSIPLPSAHPEFDRFIETDKSPLEKAQRLAILLGLSQPPTRASLLKDIVRVNVVSLASPRLQELYTWLEVEFHPLELCARVNSVVEELRADDGSPLQQYIPALQDVTLVRLVRQVSQVYQTIEIERLLELARFATAFHLERLLVDCVRHNDMQIRIDHGARCIHFGMDLSESQREDKPEGPTLQSMPSEQVRNQLVNMATVLHRAMATINPHKKRLEREKLRTQMVVHYQETMSQEHQRILARHKIIEDRKEYIERLNTVREEEEARRQEEQARQQMLQEQKRLELEREERERKRQENEIQQIKDRHLKEKMQQISQTSHGQKILKKLDEDDIKKLDAEQIAAREAEELQKERRELLQKLKSQEKKVDYFERAKRIEEIPLLQQAFEEKQVQDRTFWEQLEAERIQEAMAEREVAVQHRERLARMKEDKDVFVEKLKAERRTVYLEKLKEFEKMLEEEQKKRLAERKVQRKEETRAKWLKEKEEEEERKREEEQRLQEEEARRKQEEEEMRRKLRKEMEDEEYRKQKELLDRQAEQARNREREAEEKLLEKERAAAAAATSNWRRNPVGAVPLPPSQLRSERDPDRDATDGPRKDRDSDWRSKSLLASPAPSSLRDEPPPRSKPESWRPSRLRESEGKSADPWRRSTDAEKNDKDVRDNRDSRDIRDSRDARDLRDKDNRDIRDKDRDVRDRDSKDVREKHYRDRDTRDIRDKDGREIRDRDGKDMRDRDNRDVRDKDSRDLRDRDSRDMRDRDGRDGRDKDSRDMRDKDSRDVRDGRDRGGYDRDGGFDRFDRERDQGVFGRDRGYDRDRGSSSTTSSWRSKPSVQDPDDDRRGMPRRDERRPPPPMNRKEDRPPGPSDWRKEPADRRPAEPSVPRRPPGDDRKRVDERGRGDRVPRDEPRSREQVPSEDGVEDGNWQKVSRR